MPIRNLPALDSFDYQYLLYVHRTAQQRRLAQQHRERRAIIAWPLRCLAEAMAFLHDGTIQRGMQLELI